MSIDAILPPPAVRALERARDARFSYAVRILRAPDGRAVVVLGEAHLKLEPASELGKQVVSAFELRGVESFQWRRVLSGWLLRFFIHGPRLALRALSFGHIKGSTITDAKELPSGHTVEVERSPSPTPLGLHIASIYMTCFFALAFLGWLALFVQDHISGLAATAAGLGSWLTLLLFAFQVHFLALVPAIVLRRHSWCWVVHPFMGILTLRDWLMAEGTVQMMKDHPRAKAAVVVMGRAHVSGYERILVETYGFQRVTF